MARKPRKSKPNDVNSLAKAVLTDIYCHTPDGPDGPCWLLLWWRGGFCIYEGRTYRRLPDRELRAIVAGYLDSEGVEITQRRLGDIAEALAGIVRLDDRLSPPVWLKGINGAQIILTAQNGNVSGSDRDAQGAHRLLPHTARYFSLFAPVEYDYIPGAGCPAFLRFLGEVMGGDVEYIHLIQQWMGYLFMPGQSLQRFLLMCGSGANGKSVLIRIMEFLVGSGNVSHVALARFGARFALYETLHRRLNSVTETITKVDPESETRLREYTGGDSMSFEAKFVQEHTRQTPDAKLVMACNEPPQFRDRTSATFRRLLLVPFPVQIPEDQQDPWLAEKLKAEASGILNWALAGRDYLIERGGFTLPADHGATVEQYRREVDPVRDFLLGAYETSPNGDSVPCADVLHRYSMWAHRHGAPNLDDRTFGRLLRTVFSGVERRQRGGRADRGYVYMGLRPIGTPCTLSDSDPTRGARAGVRVE